MKRPFDAAAIPKCNARLNMAREALHRCRDAENHKEFSERWTEFLVHTGGVLNAIEAGAKETPQGRQWHGGVKREGRADSLVSYMHQARNAVEHTLETGTKKSGLEFGIGGTGRIDSLKIEKLDASGLQAKIRQRDGVPLPSLTYDPGGRPILTPVTDPRYNNTFQPPTEHNGKRLVNTDPLSVADAYLGYLAGLVSKAEELS